MAPLIALDCHLWLLRCCREIGMRFHPTRGAYTLGKVGTPAAILHVASAASWRASTHVLNCGGCCMLFCRIWDGCRVAVAAYAHMQGRAATGPLASPAASVQGSHAAVVQSKGGLPPDSCCEDEEACLQDMQRVIEEHHDNSRRAPVPFTRYL